MSNLSTATDSRGRILQAGFTEMYRNGYQGMRVDAVLAATGLKKGAFYHYFKSKRDLALAVLDEVITAQVRSVWLEPLENADDPLAALIASIEGAAQTAPPEALELGCPLNNLAQEMSPLDEAFRQRLDALFSEWTAAVGAALARAQARGTVDAGVDTTRAAEFIVAALEGCIGRTKAAKKLEQYALCTEGLIRYIEGLRPSANGPRDQPVTTLT